MRVKPQIMHADLQRYLHVHNMKGVCTFRNIRWSTDVPVPFPSSHIMCQQSPASLGRGQGCRWLCQQLVQVESKQSPHGTLLVLGHCFMLPTVT